MNNFNVRSNNKKANGNKNVSLYSGVFTPLTNDGKNAFDTSLFATYSYMLPMAWNMSNRSGFKDRDGWHVIAFNDMLGKIYDQNGNLVEGSSLTSYVRVALFRTLTATKPMSSMSVTPATHVQAVPQTTISRHAGLLKGARIRLNGTTRMSTTIQSRSSRG